VSSRGLFRIRKFNLKVRIIERNLLTAAKQIYERMCIILSLKKKSQTVSNKISYGKLLYSR